MIITGSNDISVLSVKVVWDISGVTPIIRLTNQSQGADLASVSYAFIAKSPTQTFIHDGNINSPDVTGVWTTYNISDSWPRPFNQIEWSGPPYSFQVIAKDGDGNIYYGPVQEATICRPNGNLPTSKNTYGVGNVLVQVKCDQARILFQDITNTSYRGITGTIGSSVLRVNFPMDNTGVVPDPFVGANFATAMVPITYSGKGYQFLYTSIYEYELAEDTYVRIKYLKNDTFGVWCNIDLMPLLCEYQKLINSIETGSCVDAEAANRKLMLINPKFSLVVMGMFQPLIGVDVPALIEEIQVIGGFDCDCCNVATGIATPGSSAIDGYTFSVVPLGGNIQGEVVTTGYNVQIELSDVSYIFKICDESPAQSTAFTVNSSTTEDGYTKTYCLSVDISQLSQDILTTISESSSLVNLFNSIVTPISGNNLMLVVDGGCIFQSNPSCDYTFILHNIPASGSFAIFKRFGSLTGRSTEYNYSFNQTNLAAFQTFLNTLDFGNVTVTNNGGGDVTVEILDTTADITNLEYSVASTTYFADMTKICDGFTPISANQVVQNIITYLCQLDDSKLVTSAAYEVCYIDSDGVQQTETIDAGVSLTSFITGLLSRGCETITYILSLGKVDCTTILGKFPLNTETAMQANDFFLVTKNGGCSRMYPAEVLLTLLTYGADNPDVIEAFCTMVNTCRGGFACAPYNIFYVTVEAGSPASDIDLVVTFSHPDAVSNTIRYARIDNTVTPVYTTIPNVLPGDSPYTISGVDNGQYRVGMTPVYSDGRSCTETFVDTPACDSITAFNATYDGDTIEVTYTAPVSVPYVKFNLFYPNGGSSSTIYANGDPISVTPPASVYGTFFATMQAVCNLDTQFYGPSTAQVAFDILQNNSTVTNSSAYPTGVLITTENPNGTPLPLVELGTDESAYFFIASNFYQYIYVRVGEGSRDLQDCTLVSGSNTYTGTDFGTQYFLFENVQILNGCVITITSSP